MTLTKQDIVDALQAQTGVTAQNAKERIEILLETMKKELENGNDILISGFGKFNVKQKAARVGRNPATGDRIVLDARRIVTFTCSNKLRARINAGAD